MTHSKEISSTNELDQHHKRLIYISQYLKQLRLYEGLSQIEASSMIGISRNSLQNAEHGHNTTLTTIFKIVDFYELSIAELFIDAE